METMVTWIRKRVMNFDSMSMSYGRIVSYLKRHAEVLTSCIPQSITLFGNQVIVDIISYDEVVLE